MERSWSFVTARQSSKYIEAVSWGVRRRLWHLDMAEHSWGGFTLSRFRVMM
jgi:hypothetical protein